VPWPYLQRNQMQAYLGRWTQRSSKKSRPSSRNSASHNRSSVPILRVWEHCSRWLKT